MNRLVCYVLAVITAFSLCFSTSAFVPQKIKSLHSGYASLIYDITLDGEVIEAANLSDIDARPASRLEIVLSGTDGNANLFLDQNGAPVNAADVTISKMRAANISVTVNALEGADLIQDAGLSVKAASAKPVLYVDFTPEYESAARSRFNAELTITIGGTEQPEPIRIAGSFGYPEISVAGADSLVSASGNVIVSELYIPRVLIDAGCGLTIETPLFAGMRYFASAVSGADYADISMLESNRDIVDILTLKTDGFLPEQVTGVRIDTERRFYAFDESGTLIGTTDDLLPVREKYFLSNKTGLF